MNRLFTPDDRWTGGYFELGIELGPRSDRQLRAALDRVWSHSTLTGCYLQRDLEPRDQTRYRPDAVGLGQKAYGTSRIPGAGTTCCRVLTIRLDDDSDWVVLGVPMGALSRILPVGTYPFEDGGDLSWRPLLYSWLREVAEYVYESVPFELGLTEHDVSAETCAAEIRRDGIPSTRWFGYLWPDGDALQWYKPTEGAPFTSLR
jgi:hypothetical protein